jgi:hypothetical protein
LFCDELVMNANGVNDGGGFCMSRAARSYRKEVRHFKRETRKKVFADSIFDFLFMLFGISMITCILLFVLGFWNFY